jgi:hypothetical protein
MIPDKNCSTQRRPIANFEYIFQYGGFNDLRQKFMNNDEEGESYDPNTDTKTSRYLKEDTLEYYYPKETFKEHYSSLLSKQYGLSLENINNQCYELDDDVKIQTYFKKTLLLLNHLLNDVENSKDLNVYPESKVVLDKLIIFINIKYKSYIPNGVSDKKLSLDISFAKDDDQNVVIKKVKKTSERWHALLYLLELKANNTKLPSNNDGEFIRVEIEEIGKQRIGSKGQSFYRECLKINPIISDNSLLEKSFGKDWKQKVIDISKNNILIISHLKNYY